MSLVEELKQPELEVESPSVPVNDPEHERRMLFHRAMYFRGLISSIQKRLPWPPTPKDLSERNTLEFIPTDLYNFLTLVISGDSGTDTILDGSRLEPDLYVHCQVLSISQDMIHCTTRAMVKMPKHVALPMAVRHLTGSAQLVKMLNRFRHGLSTTQMQQLATDLAEQQMERQTAGNLLPSGIDPAGATVSLAWDNNDICEETLSGMGTTHCRTGIVVQRVTAGPSLPPTNAATVQRSRRRRTLAAPGYTIIEYAAGRRCGPLPVRLPFNALRQELTHLHKQAMMKEFLWFLARYSADEDLLAPRGDQSIPGWSAFNGLDCCSVIPAQRYCLLPCDQCVSHTA